LKSAGATKKPVIVTAPINDDHARLPLAEVAGPEGETQSIEVSVIENIEQLAAELESHGLPDPDVLEGREIPLSMPGPPTWLKPLSNACPRIQSTSRFKQRSSCLE